MLRGMSVPVVGATQPIASARATSSIGGTLSGGFTLHNMVGLEGVPDYVQAVIENDATATTMGIAGLIVAPSAKVNNNYDPVDSTNAAVPWTTVTFNSGGVAHDPPSAAGAVTTLDPIAATTDATNPTRVYSDWMPIAGLDRADAGATVPLIMSRVLTQAAASTFRTMRNTYVTTYWQDSNNNQGRLLFTAHKTGDYVTTNTAGFAGASPVLLDYIQPVSWRYLSRGRGVVVMSIGDSLSAGYSLTTGWLNPYGFRSSVALSSVTRPYQWQNEAQQGLTSTQYHARAARAIPVIKPKVALIQVYSGNEANNTSAIVEAAWERAMLTAMLVRTNGGQAVFIAPYPRSFTGGTETLRQGILSRMRALAADNNFFMVDADAVLRDPANTAQLLPAYNVGDNLHITTAGEVAMTLAATPVIDRAARTV